MDSSPKDKPNNRIGQDPAHGLRTQFFLSEAKWLAFCEALDAPAKDIPELRKLLTEPGIFDP